MGSCDYLGLTKVNTFSTRDKGLELFRQDKRQRIGALLRDANKLRRFYLCWRGQCKRYLAKTYIPKAKKLIVDFKGLN